LSKIGPITTVKIKLRTVDRKVGDYEVKKCYCCENIFKLSSLTLFEGGYCPFCGEILDED